MEDLCRLCLSISSETLYKFSDDPSLILKINSSLSLNIKCIQLLPNQICKLCLNQIDETCAFQKKIIENENILLEHLNNEGDINNFYTQLKKKFKIKHESDALVNNKENEPINSNELSSDEIKPEFEENTEETYTSDDEVLSKIKQEKLQSEFKSEENINPFIETHKCLMCFKVLDTQVNLLTHYKSIHFHKKESYNNKEYTTEVIDSSVTYKCNLCAKEYRSKKNINRHLIGHSDQRPFICKICGRTYKTASEIIRHGRVHSDTKLYCSYQCGYSTVYLGALRAHERRHDQSEYKYKCDKCGKGFEVRTWYEQHQNIHIGLKPYVCDICGLAFHMDRYLTAHRSAVHPQSSSLKRYVCVHCSLPCDSKKALTEHLEVHGMKTRFLCDLCGKTLSNAEQLKFHKRMHLGEKPYTCSTCNKSFTKKFNLQVHQRTHTGERAYACVRCGRKYTQRSTLIRHYSRHHAGDEPMDCFQCQKSFPSRRLLNVHQKCCKILPTKSSI